MKFELKSIGYWSLIKVSFVINLVVGFIAGIFIALFVGLMLSFASNMGALGGSQLFPQGMPSFGILLIIYPFILGFGGAIFNTIIFLIAAFVYNVTSRVLGGLEFELQGVAVMQPVQPPQPYFSPSQPYTAPPPPPPVQPLPPDITPPPETSGPTGPTL